MSRRNKLLLAVWIIGWTVYILAGVPLATFHGDESMLIYGSQDYATAFIERRPADLTTEPPYVVDSDPHLRILNGSTAPYTMGLSWHVGGFTHADLPGLWQWGADYETNLGQNNRPSDDLLHVARLPSSLFLAASVAVIFALGWLLEGGWLATVASGLYAVNPIVLLQGRRAMQEGALFFFGMLTILIALQISRGKSTWLWWLALTLSTALTVVSKHSGVLYAVAAFGIVLVTVAQDWRSILKLALSGWLSIVIFVLLSPALWNNPPARIGDLLDVRRELLDNQTQVNPTTDVGERITGIIQQPFMEPVVHFEVAFWAGFEAITAEREAYMATPWRGMVFGSFFGAILTLFAGVAMVIAVWRRRHSALWIWSGVIVASLLANPLPWQRYYLPWIPVMTLWAGLGMVWCLRWAEGQINDGDEGCYGI